MANYQYLNPQNANNQVKYSIPQPLYTAQPSLAPTAAGVNISIQNPMATTSPINTGYNGLPCSYPQNYYVQQPINNYYPNSNNPPQQAPSAEASVTTNIPAAPVSENTKTEEKKTDKKKEIVELTDDYIKSLENYLRSEDKELRTIGAKELLKRFKEDKSRTTDAALNSLLNLTLQDPTTNVRALGLAILNSGFAGGDNTTIQLLQNMQQSKAGYGQEALEASQALIKLAGNKVEVTDNSHEDPQLKHLRKILNEK